MASSKGGLHFGDNRLQQYLKEIGTRSTLSSEEEIRLSRIISSGNALDKKKAIDKLVESNLRFVVSVARNYQNQGLPLSDLINEGNVGLIRAAGKFDGSKNFKFISYAVWWIRQSILQALAEQSRIVKIPLNRVNDIHTSKKIYSRLEQKLRRTPFLEELTEETNMTREQLEVTFGIANRHASLDAPLTEDGKVSRIDFTVSGNNFDAPDESADLGFLKKAIKETLSSLSPREEQIVRLYYGIDEEISYTLSEIGEQLNITRERVRQVKERCMEKIKAHSKTSKLRKDYLNRIN